MLNLCRLHHTPYEPSWGYQVTGYYAVDSRLGSPQDLMFLIEELHRNDIGVIMDWVPAHFPSDAHGLYRFDGSFLYEHEDERQDIIRNGIPGFLIMAEMK